MWLAIENMATSVIDTMASKAICVFASIIFPFLAYLVALGI